MNQLFQHIRTILSVDFGEDPSLKAAFEEDRQKILDQAVRIGAILAAILVPFFGVLDYFLKSELFLVFLYIRLSVIFIAIAIILLSETEWGKRYPFYLGAFLALVVSGSVSLMCVLDTGPTDPYYAGVNLPLLGFGILLPLTLLEGVPVFLIAWLAYFIPNVFGITKGQIPIFFSNNFFMLSTMFVSIVASQFHLNYRKKHWLIHRQLEEAHAKIQTHSQQLEELVQERTQKLLQSERLAVVGQLAGGIAHDFNNHLTAILGVSELLLRTPRMRKWIKEDIQSIHTAGRRATDLVKQLLTFSRKQIVNPEVISLNDSIQAIRKLLQRLIGEDIELLYNLESDLHFVRIDPVQVEQIVMNLAVNARDALPKGGTVLIETTNITLGEEYFDSRHLSLQSGDYICLSMTDNGHGMTEKVKNKIFEPFFTTKEKGSGTGLGLASVFGIVKQGGGDIMVYSEIGFGTTFKIFLPAVEEKALVKKEFDPMKAVLPTGDETILLVEDEDSVRSFTARLLLSQGYKVVEAREGREALRKVQGLKKPIDLLMTDVVMPHMNGHDLASRLSKIYTGLKVLYISGYSSAFIANRGITNPGKDFLQKPFNIEALSSKVREVIEN